VALLDVAAALCSDAVAAYLMHCLLSESYRRRGQCASAMCRHPSSPRLFQSTNSSSTQPNIERPLRQSLLVAVDLQDYLGQLISV
jgi:hypothetical protein